MDMDFVADKGNTKRPWWLDDDKVLDRIDGKLTVLKIEELTDEQFKKYKEEGKIPEGYER